MQTVLATYREPFGLAPVVRKLPVGETLAGMAARMDGLPADFAERGVICLNGHPVGRPLWGMIRPKAPAITEITFHYPPQGGGGGGGGKNILAIVASIGLSLLTAGIAGGMILGGLTGAAAGVPTVMSLALAAGVSLVGSLLVSALIPPPSIDMGKGRGRPQGLGAASAQGNVLEPNAPIPRVVGERKVFPPLAAEPLTYFDKADEVVEAAYVLAGPHRLADVKVGATDAFSLAGVEVDTREGWPGERPTGLVSRQSRTEALQSEITAHRVDPDNGYELEYEEESEEALPQVQVVATRDFPDEHQLQLTFPQGLNFKAEDTTAMMMPFRLRIRDAANGGPWIKLPELHFRAASLRQLRTTIRLLWRDDASTSPNAATIEGWFEARIEAPDQADPVGGGWQADAYFDKANGGEPFMTQAVIATTRVDHVILDRYTATIVLDRAIFNAPRYEIEIQRGMTYKAADYNTGAYTVGGSVRALFGYYSSPERIYQTRNGMIDTVYLLRSVSIWDAHPLPSRDLAVVAVRARNRQLDRVSVVAGGYVRDWDGSGWWDWKVTDNPAPHLRDIWIGAENPDPVPSPLIDDVELLAWRAHCNTMGYRCNALIEDQTLDDAARIVAACGYAHPRMSDTWGVVTDYDRAQEAPVQIFSPRNSADFQWTKGFAHVPDGLRVNFTDKSRGYDPHQISVFRPGQSNDDGRVEQVAYEGLVTEAEVIQRARYDQAQALWRNVFYSWTAPAEAIICRRGDLIGFQHHMLTRWSGAGRIVAVETDGNGDVVAVALDEAMPGGVGLDMLGSPDLLAEPDLLALGMAMGAAIRREGGAVTVHPVDDVTDGGQRVEFNPPLDPADLTMGCLVVFGPVGQEMLRLVVAGVTPREDFTATITAVDEAPQLWEMMNA